MVTTYRVGETIGDRFQVFQIAHGGVGIVYLCLDLHNNILVALKTLQALFQSDARRQESFRNETAVWIGLGRHPNIVQFREWLMIEDQMYIVLECIMAEEAAPLGARDDPEKLSPGTSAAPTNEAAKDVSLEALLKDGGALDLETALTFALDICRGMSYANSQWTTGIVHRDLKTSNILIGKARIAKITDFGLAQIIGQQTFDLGRGTPAYMSPEQWRDEALDTRSDIYAMGCILHELRTGVPLFQADLDPDVPRITPDAPLYAALFHSAGAWRCDHTLSR